MEKFVNFHQATLPPEHLVNILLLELQHLSQKQKLFFLNNRSTNFMDIPLKMDFQLSQLSTGHLKMDVYFFYYFFFFWLVED